MIRLLNLASGLSTEEILDDYPELEKDDIKAALLYASKILESEKIYKVNRSNIPVKGSAQNGCSGLES